MSDSPIDRYVKRGTLHDARAPHDGRGTRQEPEQYKPDAAEPEADDLGCFGYLRGVRERAPMLELRRRDGHVLAIGYAWIERVEHHPHEGITLHAAGRSVRIIGCNLDRPRPVSLLHGVLRHRVLWVRESDRHESIAADSDATHVERIDWGGR